MLLLLFLVNVLHIVGVFDDIKVVNTELPSILIATASSPWTPPEVTAEMAFVATLTSKHGLQEETNITAEVGDQQPQHVARGYLYGKFPNCILKTGSTRPSIHSTHGVVLEVGDLRVTEATKDAWQKRLSKRLDGSNAQVDVRIVDKGEELLVKTTERSGGSGKECGSMEIAKNI